MSGSEINQGVTFIANGADTIVAGGADTITMQAPGALTLGSSTAASGFGNVIIADAADTIASGGLDTISMLGSGALAFTGPKETVTAAAADTVVGGAGGDETIITSGQGAVVFGPGSPQTSSPFFSGNVFINTGGADTIISRAAVAQTPPDTIFAVAGGGTYFLNGITEFVGGSSGTSTVIAAPGSNNLLFTGSASLLYFASAGTNSNIDVQGGSSTIVANQAISTQAGQSSYQGATITAFADNGSVLVVAGPGSGDQYIAGSGSSTINAGGSTGYNTFFAGSGNTSLVGGSGADYPSTSSGSIANLPAAANLFEAGAGAATMVGGAGNNEFQFTSGVAGGTDLIENWNSNDHLDLFRYLGNPIVSQVVSGGSTVITLTDNTRITIAGITQLNSNQILIG